MNCVKYAWFIAVLLLFMWSRVVALDHEVQVIHADNIEYSENIIKLIGDVKIVYGEKFIFSDNVSYNMKTRVLESSGNIKIQDEEGNVFTSNSMKIEEKFRNGFLKNAKLVTSDKIYIQATSLRFIGSNLLMDKAEYTPCYKCVTGDRLTWKICADQVERKDESIIYKNAVFRILDIPVLFLPYFSHPDFAVKRKTGMLLPLLSLSSSYGGAIALRYVFAISQSQELILKPIFTSKIGEAFWMSYANRFHNGLFNIDTSLTSTKSVKLLHSSDEFENKEIKRIKSNGYRGHIFSSLKYNIDKNYRGFIDVNLVSDKYYFRKFPFVHAESKNLLESGAGIERFNEQDYSSLKCIFFQTLRPEENTNDIPRVLPIFYNSSVWKGLGGDLNFDLFGTHLDFKENHNTDKVFSNIGWDRDYIIGNGHVISLGAKVIASLNRISYKSDYITNGKNKSLNALSPLLAVTWKWPWIFDKFSKGIEVMLQPVVSVVCTTDKKVNAVFEDPYTSLRFFELSDSNLFEPLRSPMSVNLNDNSRISIGVLASAYKNSDRLANFMIGRSYNLSNVKYIDDTKYLKNKKSNIVSSMDLFLGKGLSMTFSGSYSPILKAMPRKELFVRYKNEKFNVSGSIFQYIFDEDEDVKITRVMKKYKGLSLSAGVRVTDTFTLKGSVSTGGNKLLKALKHSIGVEYKNECIRADVRFIMSRYRAGDIKPSKAIAITIVFKTLGKFDQKL